jgi:hypothetical protein
MRLLLRLLCGMTFVSALSAQVPVAGSMELGGFVGATYGIGTYAEMGGGNFSYAVNKYVLPYVEFSYFPQIQRQLTGTVPGTSTTYKADYTLRGTDFHGGIHLRVPIKESRIVPYGVFGVGYMGYGSGVINATYTDPTDGRTHSAGQINSPGGARVAINFGGGLRFYVHPRFGLRAEAKGYKPFGEVSGQNLGYGNPFLKVEGGFFFTFK